MNKLFLVPTPIGNLEDMTYRAVRVLGEVGLILAEDTRTTKKLLNHYGISTRMESYHKFNEHHKAEGFVQRIKSGESLALVSDAGTPAISDPGYLLVKGCIEENIEVECLPGATALIPALVNSGFPNDRFCFEGFLPHKKGRKTMILNLSKESRTIILYESPHRILRTLKDLQEVMGNERKCAVSRELTKVYEETIRGSFTELYEHFSNHTPRGEMVIVIAAL